MATHLPWRTFGVLACAGRLWLPPIVRGIMLLTLRPLAVCVAVVAQIVLGGEWL